MHAFCIFEGGGAKGYAHVGVLKEVENARIDVKGYAGTSAGAVIATLACVGYSADDLLNPTRRTHLVDTLFGTQTKPYDLLGPGKKRILRAAYGRAPIRLAKNLNIPFAAKIDTAERVISLTGDFLMQRDGLSTTHAARRAIEHAIHKKYDCMGRATFAELFTHTGKPLRIVAANISRRTMMLFSEQETPDVVVSDAVAASIAIPGVFEPVKLQVPNLDGSGLERCLFADGGLVSNLPAWAFDSERALDREVLTILSEITEPVAVKPLVRPAQLLSPLLRTAIFGASRLNVRSIGLSLVVPLSVSRDLLDFEPSWDDLAREIADSQNRAAICMRDDQEIGSWVEKVRSRVDRLCRENGKEDGRVRACLATSSTAEPFVQEYADDVMQLRYCRGFAKDPDFRQVLSFRRSFLGNAMRQDYEDRVAKNATQDVVYQGFMINREGVYQDGVIGGDSRDWRVISQIPDALRWWLLIPIRALVGSFPFTDVVLCIDGTYLLDDEDIEDKILQSTLDYVINTVPDIMAGEER